MANRLATTNAPSRAGRLTFLTVAIPILLLPSRLRRAASYVRKLRLAQRAIPTTTDLPLHSPDAILRRTAVCSNRPRSRIGVLELWVASASLCRVLIGRGVLLARRGWVTPRVRIRPTRARALAALGVTRDLAITRSRRAVHARSFLWFRSSFDLGERWQASPGNLTHSPCQCWARLKPVLADGRRQNPELCAVFRDRAARDSIATIHQHVADAHVRQ